MLRSKQRSPANGWMPCRRKGVVSEGLSVYSPGRRRKKKARMIMLGTPIVMLQVELRAITAILRMT